MSDPDPATLAFASPPRPTTRHARTVRALKRTVASLLAVATMLSLTGYALMGH